MIIFFSIQNGIAQRFNESFILRVLPDEAFVLKLKKNDKYEYYKWNGYGGVTTLSTGNYSVTDDMIFFTCIKKDSSYSGKLPDKFYWEKVKLKKYEKIVGCYFERRKSIIGRKYLVLSNEKFNDSLIKVFRPNVEMLITKDQFRKRKNKLYFNSKQLVRYIEKWNHKKIKNSVKVNEEKSSLFNEIYLTDKRKLKKYETEINNAEAIFDYGYPFKVIFFDENGDESDRFEFYYYTNKLSAETLAFVNKIRKLFDEI